jgi:hypothetical protein
MGAIAGAWKPRQNASHAGGAGTLEIIELFGSFKNALLTIKSFLREYPSKLLI